MINGSTVASRGVKHTMLQRIKQVVMLGSLAISGQAAVPTDSGDLSSQDGAALFNAHCMSCHAGAVPRAPHFISFNMMSTDTLLAVMNEGAMRRQAEHLSTTERALIADYLSETTQEAVVSPNCEMPSTPVVPEVGDGSPWTGWGGGNRNHRFRDFAGSGVSPASVSSLSLKWAFAYPGATRARSQPLVYGDKIFVGSQTGAVYALDLESGCVHWVYQAGAEVRNGPSLVMPESGTGPHIVFGDFKARVHAVGVNDGHARWMTDVSTHPDATITGSVKVTGGRVLVPMSSSEWASAADPGYACCTFRGSVTALDSETGELLWHTPVIPDQPTPTGERNAAGAPRIAPSGAPVWNTPSIDTARGVLYVGTGESYTSPASESSDAIIAMRLEDGEILWRKQLLAGDAWNLACFIGGGPNCPEENGPDLDIGAATILFEMPSQSLLLVGQKSGDVYALDVANQGEIVWQRKLGRGGFAGGVHWGMTTDGERLYVPIADTDFLGLAKGEPFPGLYALDPLTGETLWYVRATDECAEETKPACDPGLSAAATSTEGLVFAGAFDGHLRAYAAATGQVLWDFNTAAVFQAVNGGEAKGGSIESDGPVLAAGHVLINSGYQFGGRMPGNALLVFSTDASPAVKE
jgi:polyvinyl alcohol dehydrogenase (cytochrome)